jgi:hypothetical protein
VTITRRSLLASLGIVLPAALAASEAEAATGPVRHHRTKHHVRAVSSRLHRRKIHHGTAHSAEGVIRPRTQA